MEFEESSHSLLSRRQTGMVSMSFLSDQMEFEESSHSLLSRRQTEMGSRYIAESEVYMASFATTIFIAVLVIIRVLMIALILMLDSCQSRNSGAVKQVKTSDPHDYSTLFAFDAELNNLEADEFPLICKHHAIQYVDKVISSLQDLNLTAQLAQSHFSTLKPNGHLDVILVDADDVLLLHNAYCRNSAQSWIKDMKHLTAMMIMKLQASGWSLILFTGKPMMNGNTTTESLVSAGYCGWTSLITRLPSGGQQKRDDHGIGSRTSIHERHDGLPRPRILLPELLPVPLQMRPCPRHEIRAGIQEERHRRRRPRHHRPPQPLHRFPHVIRRANHLEPPAPRYLVPSPLLLKLNQRQIRLHVHLHPPEKNPKSHQNPHPDPHPMGVLRVVGVVRDGAGLEVGVVEVVEEGDESDGERVTVGSGSVVGVGGEMKAERVDEGAVEVVEEVRGEEEEGEGVGAVAAVGEEEEGEPESGALHEEPREGGGDGGAPTGAAVFAVRGGDELESEDVE